MAEKKLLGLGERKLVGKPTKEKTKAGRTVYKTEEGELVSEKSRTIPIGDKWYNVPSIYAGKKYTEDELKKAIENNRIIPTSEHSNKEDAIDAAKKRSNNLSKNKIPKKGIMGRAADFLKNIDYGELAEESLPIVGETAAIKRASTAFKEGDYLGTGIEAAAGVLGVVPLFGDLAGKSVRSLFNKIKKDKDHIYIVHSGADFTGDFNPSKIGTGEGRFSPSGPKNAFRPMGDGMYGYVLDPNNVKEFDRAFKQSAKTYAENFGGRTHIFKIKKEDVEKQIPWTFKKKKLYGGEQDPSLKYDYAVERVGGDEIGGLTEIRVNPKKVTRVSEPQILTQDGTAFRKSDRYINKPSDKRGPAVDPDKFDALLQKKYPKKETYEYKGGTGKTGGGRPAILSKNNKEYAKGGNVMPIKKQMELFEEGGLNQEGGMIDAESGNKVPVGSTRKEVRDDISAKLSEGEFVMPADVVRYHGLDKMMALRDEAKMGLRKMDAMGQMGNSEEATLPEEMPFGMADLIVVAEDGKEVEMAEGGYVSMANGGDPSSNVRQLGPQYTAPTNQPIDFKKVMGDGGISFKEYRNAEGKNLLVAFVGAVPLYPIPEGYTEYTAGADEPVTPIQEVVQESLPTPQPNEERDGLNYLEGYSLDMATASTAQLENELRKQTSGIGKLASGIAFALGGPLVAGLYETGKSASANKLAVEIQRRLDSGLIPPNKVQSLTAQLAEMKKNVGFGLAPNLLELGRKAADILGIDLTKDNALTKVLSFLKDDPSGETAQKVHNNLKTSAPFMRPTGVDITGGIQPESQSIPPRSITDATRDRMRNQNALIPPVADPRVPITDATRDRMRNQNALIPPVADPRVPITDATRDRMRNQNALIPPVADYRNYKDEGRFDNPLGLPKDARYSRMYGDDTQSLQPDSTMFRTSPYRSSKEYFIENQMLPPKELFSTPSDQSSAVGGNNLTNAMMGGVNSVQPLSGNEMQLAGGEADFKKLFAEQEARNKARENFISQQNVSGVDITAGKQPERFSTPLYVGQPLTDERAIMQTRLGLENLNFNRYDRGTGAARNNDEFFPVKPPISTQRVPSVGQEEFSELRRTDSGVKDVPSFGDTDPINVVPANEFQVGAADAARENNLRLQQAEETYYDNQGFVTPVPKPPVFSVPSGMDSGMGGAIQDAQRRRESTLGQMTTPKFDPQSTVGQMTTPKFDPSSTVGQMTTPQYQPSVAATAASIYDKSFGAGAQIITGIPQVEDQVYDVRDSKQRAAANKALNIATSPGTAGTGPRAHILSSGRKVPINSAVAQYDRDQVATGYTGTDAEQNVTGKISGVNGLAGVVKSGVGNKAAKVAGKTVYKDSSGKAYTRSTFGSKVEVKQNKDGSWSNKTVGGKSVKYSKGTGVSSGHGTQNEQDNSSDKEESKIICTAMNASYGFGSYRQAVWLNYSNKHLTKEHEVGYHTLFLPLVHLAYTKDNKLIRKLLEHGTRRRTADIRAELKGTKRNTLGRIYRAVLEPLCYGVGKIKMTLGE